MPNSKLVAELQLRVQELVDSVAKLTKERDTLLRNNKQLTEELIDVKLDLANTERPSGRYGMNDDLYIHMDEFGDDY